MAGSITIALCETRHFDFEGVGHSEGEARRALKSALIEHGREFKLPPGWFDKMDISVTRYRIGEGYRDRACVTRKAKT